MQISDSGSAAALWATRPASEVGRATSLTELEKAGEVERGWKAGDRSYDRLTSADREVLFAATGSWVDSEGQLRWEPPGDPEMNQAAVRLASQMETDRRTGALVGDISSDYVTKLMERVSNGAENWVDPKILDKALAFARDRELGTATARVPVDIRA
ncbi:hypothetical protein WDZ17_15550 [Pseudokineococcus basanitobsidens]|uniref:Uncharacterized protein n=1 Tax=Pseudokineococcus basanitobsidens TaxID=1926649 RepID=A0ABU8RP20_9ACTN